MNGRIRHFRGVDGRVRLLENLPTRRDGGRRGNWDSSSRGGARRRGRNFGRADGRVLPLRSLRIGRGDGRDRTCGGGSSGDTRRQGACVHMGLLLWGCCWSRCRCWCGVRIRVGARRGRQRRRIMYTRGDRAVNTGGMGTEMRGEGGVGIRSGIMVCGRCGRSSVGIPIREDGRGIIGGWVLLVPHCARLKIGRAHV